ncbi:hypothetical protein TREES_T100020533 [Tupaia chinensis]|uniref:Uncharacterized protein n=1 Tax=Tupaia chinensis TaxID=246437 RepID=L9KWT4_TUPCH|nr:hypothetical protein TREES_T100020533 [Tupaia chinensis]
MPSAPAVPVSSCEVCVPPVLSTRERGESVLRHVWDSKRPNGDELHGEPIGCLAQRLSQDAPSPKPGDVLTVPSGCEDGGSGSTATDELSPSCQLCTAQGEGGVTLVPNAIRSELSLHPGTAA